MLGLKNLIDIQASLLKHTAFANFLHLEMIVFSGVILCSAVDRHKHFWFQDHSCDIHLARMHIMFHIRMSKFREIKC